MNIRKYLERIHYQGALAPSPESLRDLQLCHLFYVPFENLSLYVHEYIELQEQALFEKIVLCRRGGLCHELNGLFAALLRELGFNVRLLAAGVAEDSGGFAPDFDHMALMVSLAERWLVDVGFGDSFRQPLSIDRRDKQVQGERSYKIEPDGDYLVLQECEGEGAWESQYRFKLGPSVLSDFEAMCHYHQTSSQSVFAKGRICSIAKPAGRITLSEMRLIETTGSVRQERIIADEKEYAAVLARVFGIVMPR